MTYNIEMDKSMFYSYISLELNGSNKKNKLHKTN